MEREERARQEKREREERREGATQDERRQLWRRGGGGEGADERRCEREKERLQLSRCNGAINRLLVVEVEEVEGPERESVCE